MKKWIVTFVFALLLLTALPVTAQEPAKSVVFVGGAYDHPEKSFVSSVGGGFKTGPVWVMAHGKFGQNTALEPEIGYFMNVRGRLRFGLLAGPGADWIGQDSVGVTPMAYLTGAVGALVGLQWDNMSLYAGGKYKMTYKDGTSYPEGWRLWLGLAYNP